jgi:hypothetical protein
MGERVFGSGRVKAGEGGGGESSDGPGRMRSSKSMEGRRKEVGGRG